MEKKVISLFCTALLICIFGCKKNDPCDGKNDSCDGKIVYMRDIVNEKADVTSGGFVVEGIERIIPIHPDQMQQYGDGNALKITYPVIDGTFKPPYKCRLWGKLYAQNLCYTIIAGPFYFIKIDRIEYQN